MTRLFLFDVDMTLLYSGGAGSLAMDRALYDLFAIRDGFRSIEFSGRTDTAILRDALAQHALLDGSFPDVLERFKDAYLRHLATTLVEVREGRVMPGVPELLPALDARDGVRLGLATGNFRHAAMMKLAHYGLERFFPDGGFGEDSEDRAEVVELAIRRLAGAAPPAGDRIYVVGDTPLDIAAARANGVRSLAVATGRHFLDELAEAGADLVFKDLSDTQAVLSAVLD